MKRVEWLSEGRPAMLRIACAVSVVLAGTSTLVTQSDHGQEIVEISSEPSCGGCSIDLEHVASLGLTSDPVSPMLSSLVAVDSEGRFFVAPTFSPGEIAMYSPGGEFIATFGRPGHGPGEFNDFTRLRVGPGDTVHVFDLNRHSKLAPDLEAFVSLQSLPVPPSDLVFLPEGRMIVSYMLLAADGRSHPLHLLNSHGDILRSFGGDSVGPAAEQRYAMLRRLALASGNRIWVAHFNEYRIELWDANGSHYLTVVRNADWFRPWDGIPIRGEILHEKPRPRLTSVWEDTQGRLWTVINVADRNWKALGRHGPVPVGSVDLSRFWDTIIEVLDVRQGRLIARARFDESMPTFIGDAGMLHSTQETADGDIRIDVWRVRLLTR